jgi:excinuclease ABC subunit A
LKGDLRMIKGVEFIDQNPIGKSSRSNPVTYTKAYDEIRKLFSELPGALQNNLKPAHFSFNVEGGRCEECQGEGEIKVEMQFMADVRLVCESCHGMRFKEEILDVRYHGKNIFNVLEMTVEEAIEFFGKNNSTTEKRIISKLQPLADVGLEYVKLGQSSSTLSGGESQRVKLASFLSHEKGMEPTLFIFDEPTTGLHFHDIRKLLDAFNALIENGHSIVVIEHNMEVIKSADWVIDLGPEGGKAGGSLVFEGTPENLVKDKESYTGKALEGKI